MEVTEAIRNRKSTRAFMPKPVDREIITSILECARWAPSGVNSQPWQVAVVTGDTMVSPVTTATCHGCELTPDGAQRAHSSMLVMISRSTGLGIKARVDLRFRIASVTSIVYPNA